MHLKNDFEYFLQTKFDEMGVYGETPITKDNCENLYEIWSEQLDVQELIDYADEFGAKLAESMIKDMQVHNEGDGLYCDTGEDMDWACRSECTEKAVKKLTNKYLKD